MSSTRPPFILMHKLREAMAHETAEARLAGEVEIGGAYFGGHVRPTNAREDRIDRRLLKNRSSKRRVVIVLRQRGGRTLTRSFLREAEGVDFASACVEPGSILSADELAHWDLLASGFELKRVNHSEAYSENGVHTNLAESYFSRLRRMIRGEHHAVSGKYLNAYAAHAAWFEDHGRESNGVLADRLILDALAAPISRPWSGYWQRRVA
jgi:ISXO2-like transposase domain